jgi:hypothetical protein
MLLACLVVFRSRQDTPHVSDTSLGPSFEVKVVKPRLARPLFGILPTKLEEKLEPGGELWFDHTSRGAKIGSVGPNGLELSADGWNLLLETDGAGHVTPGTHLVYTMVLAEKQRTLRCRPADGGPGYLRTTTQADSDALDGRFLVEFATCETVETGKVIEWPPAPLAVRGSFTGLPHSRR